MSSRLLGHTHCEGLLVKTNVKKKKKKNGEEKKKKRLHIDRKMALTAFPGTTSLRAHLIYGTSIIIAAILNKQCRETDELKS